jgi:2-keto-4-pentenoate hydratase/2-oxohepta-3-ene-1,7-dioic acid hydratase in catechol pathway
MQRWLLILVALSSALLSGCASVVRSDIVAFHEWPADLSDKTYVFERKAYQENNLEHQNYENLVRTELQRLGFTPAQNPRSANLKVGLNYRIQAREVTVMQPVYTDPYWPYGYDHPFYGPRWRGYYGPYSDPFWYPTPVTQYREVRYQVFRLQLNIVITRSKDAKKLYDVRVDSDGDNGTLAFAMPYMVRSAFADFPGQSGVPRHLKLEIKK